MKAMLVAVLAVVAALLLGCSSSWVRTGDPGWFANCDVKSVNRDAFDAITPGMTRGTVKAYLGSPTDESLNVMHWESGPWRDAWVLFNDSGDNVTSKYWADEDTLRLSDVPAVR